MFVNSTLSCQGEGLLHACISSKGYEYACIALISRVVQNIASTDLQKEEKFPEINQLQNKVNRC